MTAFLPTRRRGKAPKRNDERESNVEFSGDGSDEELSKLNDEDEPEQDEDDEDEDDEPEPEEDMESDELSPPPSPHKPRLKIKLKLPQIPSPNASSSQGHSHSRAASTLSGPSRPSSHRGISRDVDMDVDIESEDEDDDRDEDQDDDDADAGRGTGRSTRPMTSRQAVLASVVDSSHVSLGSSRKKKQLTESEMALRREETARKRKNLTEKKLEDEKAETINRLLKKQSKSKKRNALSTADDRTPVSATPVVVQTRDGSEAEGEVETVEVVPTMYRWVSTTKGDSGDAQDKDGQVRLSFSVPVAGLPPQGVMVPSEPPRPATERSVCDVSGCEQARKYRLVRDFAKGACGMAHLKMLEHQMDVV